MLYLRSQWRKLELAIKFIHKSKQSANESNELPKEKKRYAIIF